MERATFEFTTTNGHILVMNEYITGREKREIMEIYIAAGEKKDQEPGAARPLFVAEDKTIELVVKSIDGNSDKILEGFLKLPGLDYDEVKEKVKEVVDGKKKQ